MLKHYLHVFADGQWKEPVSEHLDALQKSGLVNALDYFGVGIVGNPAHRHAVKTYFTSRGIRFSVAIEVNSGWEQVTLDKIECSDSDKVLYCHTKGAGYPSDYSDQWRRSMTVGLVYEWQRAVELLEENDAVGSHWMPLGVGAPRHFSGNFWFARGDYLNRIPRPVSQGSRWDAEMWVGGGHGLMYDLAVGAPTPGNWLYEDDIGQDGVPEGCVRFIVTNNIAGLSKGSIVVRVRDAGIEMLIKEGHLQVLGKRQERVYDYRNF